MVKFSIFILHYGFISSILHFTSYKFSNPSLFYWTTIYNRYYEQFI